MLSLKRLLRRSYHFPVCLQQLLHGVSCLDNMAQLEAPADLQLVLLRVSSAAQRRDSLCELVDYAALHGHVEVARFLVEAGTEAWQPRITRFFFVPFFFGSRFLYEVTNPTKGTLGTTWFLGYQGGGFLGLHGHRGSQLRRVEGPRRDGASSSGRRCRHLAAQCYPLPFFLFLGSWFPYKFNHPQKSGCPLL